MIRRWETGNVDCRYLRELILINWEEERQGKLLLEGREAGDGRLSLNINASDFIDYAYIMKPPWKHLSNGVWGVFKLVNTLKCQEGGTLSEGMKSQYCLTLPPHIFPYAFCFICLFLSCIHYNKLVNLRKVFLVL